MLEIRYATELKCLDMWMINKGNKSNMQKQSIPSKTTSSEVSKKCKLNKPKRMSSDKKWNENKNMMNLLYNLASLGLEIIMNQILSAPFAIKLCYNTP